MSNIELISTFLENCQESKDVSKYLIPLLNSFRMEMKTNNQILELYDELKVYEKIVNFEKEVNDFFFNFAISETLPNFFYRKIFFDILIEKIYLEEIGRFLVRINCGDFVNTKYVSSLILKIWDHVINEDIFKKWKTEEFYNKIIDKYFITNLFVRHIKFVEKIKEEDDLKIIDFPQEDRLKNLKSMEKFHNEFISFHLITSGKIEERKIREKQIKDEEDKRKIEKKKKQDEISILIKNLINEIKNIDDKKTYLSQKRQLLIQDSSYIKKFSIKNPIRSRLLLLLLFVIGTVVVFTPLLVKLNESKDIIIGIFTSVIVVLALIFGYIHKAYFNVKYDDEIKNYELDRRILVIKMDKLKNNYIHV